MFLGDLCNTCYAEQLHEGLRTFFQYLQQQRLNEIPQGRTEMLGDCLFFTRAKNPLISANEQRLEIHRRYIDVHIPLNQPETIGWRSLRSLSTPSIPYDDTKDIAFYSDEPSTFLTICPGEFLVVFPEDAHAPCIGSGLLDKIIAKIEL